MAITLHCISVWVTILSRVAVGFTGVDARSSLGYDLLLPYPPGSRHGSPHSHRHVRDCQPVYHGNATHETWPAHRSRNRNNNDGSTSTSGSGGVSPVAESRLFATEIVGYPSRWVSGHVTLVRDPLRTVSVLEPGGRGGCRQRSTAQVAETARLRDCLYAQNGGFFDIDHFECLGNVVSDGELVQNGGGVQNAQFGIRKDGTLVFGYLSEDDVRDQENPFVQLISGVVWLLRNGTVYIKESMEAECDKTQRTGSFERFVNVVSARTAVGHDAEGRLVLFHIDGKTDTRGMNLYEVADFLKDQGVINAINLDGGGSATYVANGTLASYPSDECTTRSIWRCPRAVSTVLCVHEPLCHPHNCSGHGACVRGNCQCLPGWQGPDCASLMCQPPECGDHGMCTENGCACDAGWTGSNCSQAGGCVGRAGLRRDCRSAARALQCHLCQESCPLGFYGDGCNQTCRCLNGASCDPVHGSCSCLAGFHGDLCDQECPLGFFGLGCVQVCHCAEQCSCHPATGNCNSSYHTEQQNSTMHRADYCLAQQLWKDWKTEEEVHTPRPYFTERSWLAIAAVLASLLMASAVGNLIQACRKCSARPGQKLYSYTPLHELNGGPSLGEEEEEEEEGGGGGGRGGGGGGGERRGLYQLEDSDEDSS